MQTWPGPLIKGCRHPMEFIQNGYTHGMERGCPIALARDFTSHPKVDHMLCLTHPLTTHKDEPNTQFFFFFFEKGYASIKSANRLERKKKNKASGSFLALTMSKGKSSMACATTEVLDTAAKGRCGLLTTQSHPCFSRDLTTLITIFFSLSHQYFHSMKR